MVVVLDEKRDGRVRRRGEHMGFAEDNEDRSWRCEGERNRGGEDDKGIEDADVKRRGADSENEK